MIPVPCGSGKKYKRCCLEKDEAAERAVLAARVMSADSPMSRLPDVLVEMRDKLAAAYTGDDDDELTAASNAVVDLVHDAKLDEAEKAANDLLVRFPDVHDGYDRLGMVYEARGDNKRAADCYRKVVDFIRAHPEQYNHDFEAVFHRLVAKLDPPANP